VSEFPLLTKSRRLENLLGLSSSWRLQLVTKYSCANVGNLFVKPKLQGLAFSYSAVAKTSNTKTSNPPHATLYVTFSASNLHPFLRSWSPFSPPPQTLYQMKTATELTQKATAREPPRFTHQASELTTHDYSLQWNSERSEVEGGG
jgi:hypothetical protein